jgi:hypothetical protein
VTVYRDASENRETVQASIIFDDPLLRPEYGFLNYEELLKVMDAYDFHTTIAFIPWNYKRTDSSVASLFRSRPDRFSLCVHGCDHTWAEFGKSDSEYLRKKVELATARMLDHQKNTGIRFDRVMVFPQGIFCKEALYALKEKNYLAAMNTTPDPVEGELVSDFPLYLRCKPEEICKSTNGTCFVALHHEYLSNGYGNLIKLVEQINSSFPSVVWDSVGRIVKAKESVRKERICNQNPVIDLSGKSLNGRIGNFKIRYRRMTSEIRDNYLKKTHIGNTLYNILKNRDNTG